MASRNANSNKSSSFNVSIWVLLLTNILVFQATYFMTSSRWESVIASSSTLLDSPAPGDGSVSGAKQSDHSSSGSSGKSQIHRTLNDFKSSGIDRMRKFPLTLPEGTAQNLPSIQVQSNLEKRGWDMTNSTATKYGGNKDMLHLGGFTDFDIHGVSPSTWKYMVQNIGIKSLLDVGCGRGISTSWFVLHGVNALCVEGSHDAYENSILPEKSTQMVEHDFARGAYWPSSTYDAIWCVEFLEHVGRNFHKNYIPLFRKAGLIFATHSIWGGYHHVEVHPTEWWVSKMEMYGFRYSEHLTMKIREVANSEPSKGEKAPNGQLYNAQHIWLNMMVFINPTVTALPQHHHLMADPGCYDAHKSKPGQMVNRKCGTVPDLNAEETTLPKGWEPLVLTQEQDEAWFELVKKNVQPFGREKT